MNRQITIGTVLKITRDCTENGCVGPVINIQQIADGKIAYTLNVNLNGTSTPCNVREGEYEVLGKTDLDDIIFDT